MSGIVESIRAGSGDGTLRIFIDESGSFVGYGTGSSPSAVGALVVPDNKFASLEAGWRKLRRSFPQTKGEVKGSKLDEGQVATTVDLLFRHNCLFEVVVIDLGRHTEDEVRTHQQGQTAQIGAAITDEFVPEAKASVLKLQARLAGISPQLYVQAIVNFKLVNSVRELAEHYFVLRRPAEIGRFSWIVDAKGVENKRTDWEDWWVTFLLPWSQSYSFTNPGGRFAGANYKHFEKFHSTGEWPEYLPDVLKPGDPPPLNLVAIYKDARFSSDAEPGLEMVDVLTNGIRRALRGNLKPEGWKPLRRLMIHRDQHYINLISFGDDKGKGLPYREIVRAFKTGGRLMIPAHIARSKSFWPDEPKD